MNRTLTIEITNKIATCRNNIPLVCGNSDYEIEFVFDKEWDKHYVKTAVFRFAGKSYLQVFSGTICKVPVLQNTRLVAIGVFAGTVDDGTLSTSAPVLVECHPCITDDGGEITAPEDDVYAQIVSLCEEAVSTAEDVERRANAGEFDGYTPERGVDYWTPEDVEKAEGYIDEKISGTDVSTKRIIADSPLDMRTQNINNVGAILSAILNVANSSLYVTKDAMTAKVPNIYLEAFGQNILSAHNTDNSEYGECVLRASDINFVKNNIGGNAWLRMGNSGTMEIQCVKGNFTLGTQNGHFNLYNRSGGQTIIHSVSIPYADTDAANKKYVDDGLRDKVSNEDLQAIKDALDSIIAIQESLIGGETV